MNDTDDGAPTARNDSGRFVTKYDDESLVAELAAAAPEPLSATELTESTDMPRTSVHYRLDKLVDDGRVETKKVGAKARVYWLSPQRPDVESPEAPA